MKTLSLSMLIVGSIIGAGFASGRELVSFFSSDIPLYVAPLCGIGIFLCAVLFLSIGSKINANGLNAVNRAVAGKAHAIADAFLLFNSLVVLSGMLSCIDSLFSLVLPIAPAYSIIAGILCALIVSRGIKGLFKCNLFIVPTVIVAIIIICSISITQPRFFFSFRPFDIVAVITYVSMNMMLASTIFTSINGLTKRQIITASAIGATIISSIMLVMILALNANKIDGAMPLMQLALTKSKPLFYVSIVAVAISVFTTITTAMTGLNNWLGGLMGEKSRYSIVIVTIAGLIVSNLGFENVVGYLYPIIGIFGIVYICLSVLFIVRTNKCPLALPQPQSQPQSPQHQPQYQPQYQPQPVGIQKRKSYNLPVEFIHDSLPKKVI